MEVVVATGAIRRAKLQSNCYHQQTNTQSIEGRMSFLLPNQQRQGNQKGHLACKKYRTSNPHRFFIGTLGGRGQKWCDVWKIAG